MMAQRNITDRAHRYRANQLAPVAGKVCLFCGSTQFLVPDHWDGIPSHTTPDNLEVLCKACNTSKGAAFKAAGRGRLTNQFNPTKGGGAANVGEWMQAVGAITPHVDRGERGLVSSMSTQAAVDMIRATPQSKRREYAAKLRRRNPGWLWSNPDARRTTPASGGIAYNTAKRRPATAKAAASDRVKSKKAAGASAMPSEAALQAGFKRGLTLNEILAQNPALQALRKSNPAKFDRCVKAVQRKGGAANAYAVCSAAGAQNPGDGPRPGESGIDFGHRQDAENKEVMRLRSMIEAADIQDLPAIRATVKKFNNRQRRVLSDSLGLSSTAELNKMLRGGVCGLRVSVSLD